MINPQQSIQHFIRINYARKDSSVSTKLRIISNSASKNKSGVSLNDMVLCGPSNLNSPLKLVLQWRMFPVGFTADISRFYRSIFITKICQQVRLFYFFEEPTDEQPQCFTINLDYEAGYRDYCEKFSVSSTHYILLF